MGILSKCPTCKTKQSIKNKQCKCGRDLDKAKKAGRVMYWIDYRIPDGKQRRESVAAMVGLSVNNLEDAKSHCRKRGMAMRRTVSPGFGRAVYVTEPASVHRI